MVAFFAEQATAWVACACLAALAFVAALAYATSSRKPPSCHAPAVTALPPPVVRGLPLLGSALALGSGGAAFLHKCRAKHGDAFTLRLLGQRMTFVFAPASLVRYFTAPDEELTFGPAVQQFTHRVFGLAPKIFFNKHHTMLQALRHLLVPATLPRHTSRLLRLLLARLQRWPASGQLELVSELKSLVFEASVGALFGESFLAGPGSPGASASGSSKPRDTGGRGSTGTGSGGKSGPSTEGTNNSGTAGGTAAPEADPSWAGRLQQAFFEFEEGFELAASPVPHAFQPRFRAARRRLLAALRQSLQAGHFEGTVAGELIQACGLPEPYVPNMLLAVLWASQANAVPTAFWSLAFLLLPENRQHMEAVVAEAQAAVAAADAAAEAQAAAAGADAAAEAQAAVAAADAAAAAAGADAAAEDGGLQRTQQPGQGEQAQQQQRQQQADSQQLLTEAQQSALVALAADRHSKAAAAVAEAMRLRSFSIDVRVAASDCVLPGGDGSRPGHEPAVIVRKGDVVAICPYLSHMDPRLYGPDSEAYRPWREGMRLGGSTAAHAAVVGVGGVPGLSFGGGKYRCPGRYFAEAELALVTSLLLLLFDWQLLPVEGAPAGSSGVPAPTSHGGDAAGERNSGVQQSRGAQQHVQHQQRQSMQAAFPGDPSRLLPAPDLRKLVGIKVPAGPCWVQFMRRQLN